MQRSSFLLSAAAAAALPAAAVAVPAAPGRLTELEQHTGGRLGVYALDTGSGARIAHRAGERFPMCSTFKTLLVAAVLGRVDHGKEHLQRGIAYGESDLLHYAPVTRKNVRRGRLSVGELCSATLEWSDNTAANLLLASIGGPSAVTAFARLIGDTQTRLDRTEPALNTALPGDPRDTTTPRAMTENWRALLLGTALSPHSRSVLLAGLLACKTGTARLRAGIPVAWREGDKTGTGDNGTSNDLAILLPPKRAPILVAAYLTGSTLDGDARDAALAQVGRFVVASFSA